MEAPVGQLKPPFLREELIGAPQQLAVERSYSADYFTTDFSQGIQLSYWRDRLQLMAALHDGSYSFRTDFQNDRTLYAVAGRVDYVLVGDIATIRQRGWPQFNDFTSWVDDQPAILLGAAVDYEHAEEGFGTNAPNTLKWIVDVSGEFGGWNVFAAVTGQSFPEFEDSSVRANGTTVNNLRNLGGAHQLGVLVQGGVFVIPNKLEFFSRYECLNFDGVYYRNDGGAV